MKRPRLLGRSMALVLGLATAAQGAKPYKVALITDIPPRASTHDFRGLEYLGFLRAVRELARPGPRRPDQPEERRRRRARAAGPPEVRPRLHGPRLDPRGGSRCGAVPRNAFPLPGPVRLAQSKPANVQGEDFRIEQAGYLAGYLAGLMETRRPGKDVIGSVAGLSLPPIDDWIVGFELGAKRPIPASPCSGATRTTSRTPRSARPSPGPRSPAARACSSRSPGCAAAAPWRQRRRTACGASASTATSRTWARTSSRARSRVRRRRLPRDRGARQGRLETRGDYRYDLANGGVALGRISPEVPQSVLRRLDAVRARIVAGAIRVPRST